MAIAHLYYTVLFSDLEYFVKCLWACQRSGISKKKKPVDFVDGSKAPGTYSNAGFYSGNPDQLPASFFSILTAYLVMDFLKFLSGFYEHVHHLFGSRIRLLPRVGEVFESQGNRLRIAAIATKSMEITRTFSQSRLARFSVGHVLRRHRNYRKKVPSFKKRNYVNPGQIPHRIVSFP